MEAHQIWDVNFKKFTQFIKAKVTPRGQIKVQCIKTLKVSDSGHLCCGIKNIGHFRYKFGWGKGGEATHTRLVSLICSCFVICAFFSE